MHCAFHHHCYLLLHCAPPAALGRSLSVCRFCILPGTEGKILLPQLGIHIQTSVQAAIILFFTMDENTPPRQAVRFTSNNEEIEPDRILPDGDGKPREDLSPEAVEELRSLSKRMQMNRMNSGYEPISLPSSRVSETLIRHYCLVGIMGHLH